MSVDPNVQVAIVSVFATGITTSGVVLVAYLNSNKHKGNGDPPPKDDDDEVLDRIFDLLSENKRKEKTISALNVKRKDLEGQIKELNGQVTALTEAVEIYRRADQIRMHRQRDSDD